MNTQALITPMLRAFAMSDETKPEPEIAWPVKNAEYYAKLRRDEEDNFRRHYIAEFPEERGTGRTSRQLRNAPHGALYVALNQADRTHTLHMAREMGRDDLEITTVSTFVFHGYERLFGTKRQYVIDHACWDPSVGGYNLYYRLLDITKEIDAHLEYRNAHQR